MTERPHQELAIDALSDLRTLRGKVAANGFADSAATRASEVIVLLLDAATETAAEIDALRSGLEAMRRERDEYAAAASDLMRYYDNCFDQRLQAVPANIAIIDPIKFILGQKPCYFGRRPDDRDRLAAEWDELRAAARSVRNGE